MAPPYANPVRPFASRHLIAIPVDTSDGARSLFTIDTSTQRWLIVRPEVLSVLSLADGKTPVDDLASQVLSSHPVFENEVVVKTLIEELLRLGMLHFGQAQHTEAASEIYNACTPTGLHIEITNACNMTCTHCYVASGVPLPNEMTMEEIYRAVDMLPPFSGRQIAISGGEPIVRKGCMDLVEYCAEQCGHHVDLYTNGRRFPRKYAESLVRMNTKSGVNVRVQVSLEGAQAVTNDVVRGQGSFDDTIATLEMFREVGLSPHVVLFVCLTKANINEVDELIRLAEFWEVGMLVFSQWQRQGNAKDVPWASIAPTAAEWTAAGLKILSYKNPSLQLYGNFYGDLSNDQRGRLSLDSPLFPKQLYFYNAFPRVTPQGDIFADQLWVDRTWILGNIRRGDDLRSCFSSPAFFAQLQKMRQRVAAVDDCNSCVWRDLCGGGSAGHTYAEYGHMNAKDLFCESRMWWFEKYVEHHVERCLGPGAKAAFDGSIHVARQASH